MKFNVEIKDSETNTTVDELIGFDSELAAISAAEKYIESLSEEERFYTEYVIRKN